MQLLEINDMFSPNSHREQQFELLSSRPSQMHDLLHTTATNLRESRESPFNLSMSALPILGCVFGLIFIMTLANILLNSISCWPNRRRRDGRQSPMGFVSTSTARRRHQQRRRSNQQQHLHSAVGVTSSNQHLGSSFYSDNSDTSGGSQARFMVVGGKDKGEPAFAGSSASYFEMPTDQTLRAGSAAAAAAAAADGSTAAGGARRTAAQSSSANYLLAAQASRFPLGPSFEGDGKHNADMVGLARKNYDNFINNIYNSSDGQMDGHQQQQHQIPCPSSSSSRHSHNHRSHTNHDHTHVPRPSSHSASLQSSSVAAAAAAAEGQLHPTMTADAATRPVSSSAAAVGGASGQQEAHSSRISSKHRLRFDKINPIYHMEGLYASRAAPAALSSFGQVNAALDMGPESPGNRSNSSGSQTINAGQCHLCDLEQQHPGNGESCDEKSCGLRCTGDDDNDDPRGVQEFACCLDRQQQRFHKQQQQLERVMSKSGSLVPQPFINPTISTSSASNVGDDGNDGNDLESFDETSSRGRRVAQAAAAAANDDRPDERGQTTAREQQVNSTYLFGDTTAMAAPEQSDPAAAETTAVEAAAAAEQVTPEMGESKTLLVAVGSMQRATPSATDAGASIQRGDFDQRRKQLASKLQLKGMQQQQQPAASSTTSTN